MSILRPAMTSHPIHTLHRVSIGCLGLFLLLFGMLGLTRHLGFLSSHGAIVMGLSTNGLLATISVVVGLVLAAASVRGGPTASMVGIVFGIIFLISGLANILVLGSAMNMLAFRLSNVIFSLAVGTVLLFIGAYGRLSGGLPPDNPYFHERVHPAPGKGYPLPRSTAQQLSDAATDRELAEAERAVALRYATSEQAEGVRKAAAYRRPEDRRRAWRSHVDGHGKTRVVDQD
jgi:hypothetical protein